jgi:hypothetical protein
VEQRGIDVAVRLDGPDGAVLAESDRAERTGGRESLPAIARVAGLHRLRVTAAREAPGTGRCRVSSTPPRPPTPADHDRIAAEDAFAEGERLRREKGPEAGRKALDALSTSQALFARLGDVHGEADPCLGAQARLERAGREHAG